MSGCTKCGRTVAFEDCYCRYCGQPQDTLSTQTFVPSTSGAAAAPSPARSMPHDDAHRFRPGTVIGDRYQILRLAGRGGMGEVYCAYDLKLTQVVALKFLPEETSGDHNALERLLTEVRLARKVSHSNVCRVYDAGEFEHHTFLSMEYIDGEDLSSLLRRIGRIPVDKGVEIARKLCSGLAAAHAKGVLHLELKPASALIDKEGQVVITDFGLATTLLQEAGSSGLAGTPAYMAPEQFDGSDATVQTDIYSLGLVLYEIFTGKRLYDADSLSELRRLHHSLPPNPSSIVPEIDAATERAILWCLEPDQRRRPPSAVAIAAALPGGDPLAAALAAGQTPSPELIAAGGGAVKLRHITAASLFFLTLVFVTLAVVYGPQASIAGTSSLEFPPAVLAQKGREIAAEFGYPDRPLDRVYGFCYSRVYLQARERTWPDAARWTLMYLRYREAPMYLTPQRFFADGLVTGWAAGYDPQRFRSRSIDLNLDPKGKLLAFDAVPPEVDEPGQLEPREIDWSRVLRAAGLNPANFKQVAPSRNAPAPFDARASWVGIDLSRSTTPFRVEAAAWRGKIVHFNLIPPWSAPPRMSPVTSTGAQQIQAISGWLLDIAVVFAGVLLVRRHLSAGRGDVHGATLLAAFVLALELLMFVLAAHHVPTEHELRLITMALAWGLLKASAIWIVYLALEPFVRRFWPEILISWSRVLSGRWSDARVGRDIMVGVCLGSAGFLIRLGEAMWGMSEGAPPSHTVLLESLLGGPYAAAVLVSALSSALLITFIAFLAVFLLKLLVKNQYAAAGAFVLIVAPVLSFTSPAPLITACFTAVGILFFLFVLLRFGFLAAVAWSFTILLLHFFPLTAELTSWHFSISTVPWLVIGGLSVAGWRAATRYAGH